MLHVKNTLSIPFPIDNPIIEAAVNKDALIFDIETTGLNPHRNHVVLIGFMKFDPRGRLIMNQLFIEDPSEEPELLAAFHRIACASGFYITFNGASFDLPFLNTRMKKHRQNQSLDPYYNVDIMRAIKTKHFDLSLENHKQKTVEKFMGISRSDKISGRESVELYEKYLQTGDESLRNSILLHNSDDIVNLYKLIEIFKFADIPEIFFDFSNELIAGGITFRIMNCKKNGSFVSVKGKCLERLEYGHVYNDALFSFELDAKNMDFNLRIPVIDEMIAGKDYSFIDYKAIPFASELIKSFISVEPRRLILYEDGILSSHNLKSLILILLDGIF